MLKCWYCGNENPDGTIKCPLCEKVQRRPQHAPGPIGEFFLSGIGDILKGHNFHITKEGIHVGRQPEGNELVIPDSEVSRRHAWIYLGDDKQVHVEDMSANGTYVNAERVSKTTLHPGDKVRFGLAPENLFLMFQEKRGFDDISCTPIIAQNAPVEDERPVQYFPEPEDKAVRVDGPHDAYRGGQIPKQPVVEPPLPPKFMRPEPPAKPVSPPPPPPPPPAPVMFAAAKPAPAPEVKSPEPPKPGKNKQTMFAKVEAAPKKQTVFMKADEAPAPQCRLQLILDQYAVEDFPIEGKVTLGRDPGVGRLAIDHESVSATHAEVEVGSDGQAILRDLGSKNGTYVNGEKVDEKHLSDGDLIQLAACDSHLLLFRENRRRTAILRDLELDKPVVTLGRDGGNDIQLDHPTVSSFHAEIRKSNGVVELLDKGSSNGTYVNASRITRQKLQKGDRIRLGAFELVFDGQQMESAGDGTRVRLAASGLRYEIRDGSTGKTLRLLDDIAIAVEPCEFVGLLGPSGSGKTLLIDALSGARQANAGRVTLNDADLYAEFPALRAVIGSLPQEDILHRLLTVRECLFYAGRLRLPDDFPDAEIKQRVEEVIRTLDLKERGDIPIAQLSGGQRKRVSLAIELLSKPGLLFIDEPTAGQDPRTEMKLMQMFREIANRGTTVILSTHLFGSFSLLDKVAVLAGGRLAYFGPSSEMLKYFKATRPHEVYDRLQERPAEDWARDFRNSPLYKEHLSDLGGGGRRAAAPQSKPVKHSWLRQLRTLLSRQMALKMKDMMNFAVLLVPPVVIAGLVGVMRQASNEPKSLFMAVMVAVWLGCSAAVRELVDERAIYRRERQRDLKLVSYLGAKLIYLAVLGALQSALFMVVANYFGAIDRHFAAAFLIIWALNFEGALIGLLISAVANSPEQAIYAFPLVLIPQLLLAGVLIPVNTIQPFYPVLNKEAHRIEIQQPPADMAAQGMGPVLRNGLSPLMVARWGTEALTDLYVHDYQVLPPLERREARYCLNLLNSISVSLHPGDAADLRIFLASQNPDEKDETRQPPPPHRDTALPQYAGILGGIGGIMLLLTTLMMRRKETLGT